MNTFKKATVGLLVGLVAVLGLAGCDSEDKKETVKQDSNKSLSYTELAKKYNITYKEGDDKKVFLNAVLDKMDSKVKRGESLKSVKSIFSNVKKYETTLEGSPKNTMTFKVNRYGEESFTQLMFDKDSNYLQTYHIYTKINSFDKAKKFLAAKKLVLKEDGFKKNEIKSDGKVVGYFQQFQEEETKNTFLMNKWVHGKDINYSLAEVSFGSGELSSN